MTIKQESTTTLLLPHYNI